MRGKVWVITGLCVASVGAQAQQHDENERAQLAKALKDTAITLEKALLAAEHEGTPISAKFEVQKGKIELSVYAAKGGDRFAEINVDPKTGKISKVEEIKGGGDLAEARNQSESFTRAKLSLRAATERAVKANPGGRAVSVAPSVRSGRPVADVTLVAGNRFKTVTERLD